MTVYVDGARNRLGRMLLCHMLSDTLDELHAMADRIGVSRRHFQASNKGVPHYDICQKMRARAIFNGAKPLTRRQLCALIEQQRQEPTQ